MLEALMTDGQKALRDEVRQYVKSVPRQLLLDMDADKIRYPRDYVIGLAKNHLLGLRFSKQYGGRGLKWVDEIVALEEIGVLGMSLGCLFSLVSIVGEALDVFEQPSPFQDGSDLRMPLEVRQQHREASLPIRVLFEIQGP